MDWAGLLDRKYNILQQNANANTTQAQADASRAASFGLTSGAEANLTNIRAGLMPAQAQADIGEAQARTAQDQALAAQTQTETKYIGPKTLADIALARAQGGLYGSEAARNTRLGFGFNFGLGGGTNPLDAMHARMLGGFGLGGGY